VSDVAVFHSALGVRAGIHDAADRLRAAGHTVTVVDQYDGRSFGDLDEASAYVDEVGFPALMQVALDAVADLPDGFSALGFSNGGGMAEHVATQRPVDRVVLASGTLPLEMLGVASWPTRTATQIHYALGDPHRNEQWLQAVVTSIETSGASVDLHTDYPGDGHLFTDPELPDHDAANTALFWQRVLAFLAG
jgi:dienelactone hydrolase